MILLKKLEKIFKMNTIAVVGMSPKIERPSHYVSQYMIENGFEIIPVNPGHNVIAGLKSYPSLTKIPKKVDIVNVFRRSKFVEAIAKDAVKIRFSAGLLKPKRIKEKISKICVISNQDFLWPK